MIRLSPCCGGTLGFRLDHSYPCNSDDSSHLVKNLPGRLKGVDAVLLEVLRGVHLKWYFKCVYDIDFDWNEFAMDGHVTEGPNEILTAFHSGFWKACTVGRLNLSMTFSSYVEPKGDRTCYGS